MINYIIIENDEKYREIYKNIINAVMDNENKDYHCYEFDSYNDSLSKIISDDTYKIYLLDVNLNGSKSGIDIAKEIRETDISNEIIFITEQDLLFELVYKSIHKVYTFISKHYKMEEILFNELFDIMNHYDQNTKFFLLDKKGDSKLAINDILYIYRETSERKVYVVTKTGSYPTYLTLKEILDLYGKYFIQIHRACLINPNHINMYNWVENYFVLKDGDQVFMCSKKYKDNVV